MSLYEASVTALKGVEPSLRVGGPASKFSSLPDFNFSPSV